MKYLPALLSLAVLPAAAAPVRPNVLVLVADDLGYGDLGCYGGQDVPTPNLDALARTGVRFTNGYVTAALCAPSRAGLLTGRYQTRFGFEENPVGAENNDPAIGVPLSERTLANRLHDAGYATALIGKWHLGGTSAFHPQRRGFDEFFGFLGEGHYSVPTPWQGVTTWLRRKMLPDGTTGQWVSPDGRAIWDTRAGYDEPAYDADNPLLRSSQPVSEPEYLTDAFTREAESFISRHKSQPFYLEVAYSAVHSPMQGADAWMKKLAHIPDLHRRVFGAMLAQLDDSVGRILAHLQTEGLAENTLVVFISDNGGPTLETASNNAPLRGMKGRLLEGGIRVPFIVSWPGRISAGQTEARMASSLDIVPTALAAAEISQPDNLDGVNLVPALRAPATTPIHERLYWRMGAHAAMREGDWKIYRGRDDKDWQLYYLANDIGESLNLATLEPDRLTALVAKWKKLSTEMVDPIWRRPGSAPIAR